MSKPRLDLPLIRAAITEIPAAASMIMFVAMVLCWAKILEIWLAVPG